MPAGPRVSVLMSVYNAERYVQDATQSILDQTFGDFEFLVVDDGSTDGSLAILERMARREERLHVISRPNTGYAAALNEASELAQGEFLARMDADDISLPGRFEEQVRFLDAHPECVGVGTGLVVIDQRGETIYEAAWSLDHDQIDADLREGRGGLPHPAAMFRREAFEKAGGYRPEFEPAEDVDLWLRLIEQGRLANLPQPLLKYRIHPHSQSATRREAQAAGVQAAVEDACRRHGRRPPDGMYRFVESIRSGPLPAEHWVRAALLAGNFRTARNLAAEQLRRTPARGGLWLLATAAWVAPYCGRTGRRVITRGGRMATRVFRRALRPLLRA